MSTMTGALPIATTELRLIVRNRAVLFSAVLFPLALAVWLFTQRDDTVNASIALIAMNILFFSTFTIYTTATTTIVTRREDLYLKRLRSGETSDSAILTGLVAPVVVLCAVQLVAVLAVMLALGVGWPQQPLLVLVAVAGMFAVCAAAGLLTAVVTPNASAAQISSMPFLLLVIGSFVMAPLVESRFTDLLPGGAVVTLVRAAYGAAIEGNVLVAVASLAVWSYVPLELARRYFVWEPRH